MLYLLLYYYITFRWILSVCVHCGLQCLCSRKILPSCYVMPRWCRYNTLTTPLPLARRRVRVVPFFVLAFMLIKMRSIQGSSVTAARRTRSAHQQNSTTRFPLARIRFARTLLNRRERENTEQKRVKIPFPLERLLCYCWVSEVI